MMLFSTRRPPDGPSVLRSILLTSGPDGAGDLLQSTNVVAPWGLDSSGGDAGCEWARRPCALDNSYRSLHHLCGKAGAPFSTFLLLFLAHGQSIALILARGSSKRGRRAAAYQADDLGSKGPQLPALFTGATQSSCRKSTAYKSAKLRSRVPRQMRARISGMRRRSSTTTTPQHPNASHFRHFPRVGQGRLFRRSSATRTATDKSITPSQTKKPEPMP